MSDAPPDAIPSWSELVRGETGLYVLLLNLGVLLYGSDLYLLFTLMPTVVADFGGMEYYTWATMFFVVSAIVGAASYAPLRARFGGRSAYALGGVIYLAGTFGCATAPAMPVFLAARLVDGFGGGLVMAGSMAYTSALFGSRLRTRAIAVTSMTWIAGALIGPLIGGVFGELDWWRGAFWALVPLILLFTVMVLWRIPAEADQAAHGARPRFPVERLLLLGLGVVCVAASGRVAEDALRLALMAVAVALIWLTLRRDAHAENRLFPSRPLSFAATVGLGYWTQLLIGMLYTSAAVYLPLVLQSVYGVPALYVGYINGGMSVCWSIASASVSGLGPRRSGWAVRAGPVLIFAGLALLATTLTGAAVAPVAAAAMLIGFGVGMNYVHSVSRTMGAARAGEESVTASSLQTIRNLGIAFGSAGAGLVATFAGLETGSPPAVLADALSWVYLVLLAPAVLLVVVAFRFARAARLVPAAAE